MATAYFKLREDQAVHIFGWDLVSGETGTALRVAPWPDKTVQVYGTFTGGGNIQIEIALDPDTPVWSIARDLSGDPISGLVAAYCEVIQQHSFFLRPVATTITAVSVRLICSAARMRI